MIYIYIYVWIVGAVDKTTNLVGCMVSFCVLCFAVCMLHSGLWAVLNEQMLEKILITSPKKEKEGVTLKENKTFQKYLSGSITSWWWGFDPPQSHKETSDHAMKAPKTMTIESHKKKQKSTLSIVKTRHIITTSKRNHQKQPLGNKHWKKSASWCESLSPWSCRSFSTTVFPAAVGGFDHKLWFSFGGLFDCYPSNIISWCIW